MCIRDSIYCAKPGMVIGKGGEERVALQDVYKRQEYTDGVKSYIIAPDGLKVGDVVISSKSADIKPGNCLPFENIPVRCV